MEIDEVIFARLRDQFTRECRRVEPYESRRVLTRNRTLREEYRREVVKTFNNICNYLRDIFQKSDSVEVKLGCIARINPYIEKCKKAFSTLKLHYEWPRDELQLINVNLITPIETPELEPIDESTEPQVRDLTDTHSITGEQAGASSSIRNDQWLTDENFDADLTVGSEQTFEDANDSRIDDLIHELSNIDIVDENNGQIQDNILSSSSSSENLNNSNENLTNMPQSPEDFLKIASTILNYKYEGDPNKLESFIADVEFLETMAKEETKNVCIKYIRHKIAGRAIECLPSSEETDSVRKIIDALRKDIKAPCSSNIESKFTSLRIVKGDLNKFADEAESLAENFRRSLVVEGFTRQKACEMAIKKTKEMCRQMARNEAAKAVIDGNRYDTPSEVIATFLEQNEKARKEKQEQELANHKRQNGKGFKKGQNSGKSNQKFNKNDKFRGKQKHGKGQKSDSRGGKDRNNRNDHVIRLVSDAGTSNEMNAQNNTEQVFRLAQS